MQEKVMKAKDMRAKSEKELTKNLDELRSQLTAVSVEYRTKEVKNVKQIAAIKKDIARILTVLGENTKGESK